MEDVLVSRFGFPRDHIRKLINGKATRQRIMEVLGDEFSDSKKIQREDRVFFFFAGHGATRTLEDGRQIGFCRAARCAPGLFYLADVYVLEDYRGRGLGVELVREMVDNGPLAGKHWLP